MESDESGIVKFSWVLGLLLLLGVGNRAWAQSAISQPVAQSPQVRRLDRLRLSVSGLAQTPASGAVLEELLSLVNGERQQAGVAPLMLNARLNQAAQGHAQDLASQGLLSHTRSGGSTMQTRIEGTGYNWSVIGENIAMGQTSSQAVMIAWMESAGHRQNILNPDFVELGLGYAEAEGQTYWVQVFAGPR